MTAYNYTDFYKFGDNFSITGKFADWIGNPVWKEGYELIANTSGYSNEYTPFWEFVSAVSEREGSQIYSKIKHLIQNVRDVDLCELYYLKAIAKELGYTGDLSYLDYDYPLEVNKLLDIFSVNKDYLLKTNKIMFSQSRDDLYANTSAEVPTGIFDSFIPEAMTEEARTTLLALSGAPSGLYYTDDAKYQTFLDSVFTDCLSTYINLKYREDEDDLTASAIWTQIANQLSDDNLFNTKRSYNAEIEKRKVDLRIDPVFNEKNIVDLLQTNKAKLDDYTIPEQEIINMEFERRETERTKYQLVSRYSPERESTVKTYFNFVIISTAKKLRNISLRTSYLREELKRLARKHNINGSELIIKILIKDLLRKYIYTTNDSNWRYSSGGYELITSATIIENSNFDIDIIEYFDKTEYLNVSTNETPSGTNESLENLGRPLINERYWDDGAEKLNYITSGEIDTFYRDVVGLDLGVPSGQYNEVLVDFLDKVYNSCATKETSETLTEAVTALLSAGTPFLSGTEILSGNWLLSANWGWDSNTEVVSSVLTTASFLSATEGGYSEEYVTQSSVKAVNVYLTGGSGAIVNPAHFNLSGEALGGFDVGDLYTLNVYTRRDGILPTQQLILSGPGLEVSGAYSTSAYADVSASIYSSFIENSAFVAPTYLDFPEATGVFEQTNTIFMATTSAVSSYTLIVSPLVSGADEGAWIASATFNKVIDLGREDDIETTYTDNGSGAFRKYSGGPDGSAPFANWKNSYHSSYARHPYLPNIYENDSTEDTIKGLVNYEAETVEVSYLSAEIADRVDGDGNTIDSWRNTNIENIGYQTKYESSLNLDGSGVTDRKIDMDGPFNYDALSAFLSDSDTYRSQILADTNEWYQNIGLIDTTHLYNQLVSYESNIRQLSGKSIFKYTVDQYENHYIVYKDDNDFNTSGELWVRPSNQPLALPAFDITDNVNSTLAVLNTIDHVNINKYGSVVYDIGYFNGIIWVVCDSDIESKVIIAAVGQEYDVNLGRNVISLTKNPEHNVEIIEIQDGYKYCGASVITNVLNVVSIESSTVSGLPPNGSVYNINIKYDVFDPDILGRYSKKADGQTVTYNEYIPSENTFRMQYNNDIMSIAFECEAPSAVVTNYVGHEPDSGGSTTVDWLKETPNYNTWDNGITIMDFELNDNPYGESIYQSDKNQDSIHYYFQHADLKHIGLYDVVEGNGDSNLSGRNDYAKYENSRVPARGFVFTGVDNSSYDLFKFQYESSKSPSAIDMQFFEQMTGNYFGYSYAQFEMFSGYFMQVYSKREDLDADVKDQINPAIYLVSDDFTWTFSETNGVNNQERKLYGSLYVHDDITEGDLISPEDLNWTEDGDAMSWESDPNVGRGYTIYSNYTFSVTDFKKSKIRIESSPITWTDE
jgi:hypothetical protein